MGRFANTEQKFWSNVDIRKQDECWLWLKAIDSTGYGVTTWHWKKWSTHRLAYVFSNGNIPKGLFVCHTCDNRRCCNPSHLFLGTHQDNMHDMVKKGRSASGDRNSLVIHPEFRPCGEQHPRHKLTKQQTLEIRSLGAQGIPQRTIAKQFNVSQVQIGNILRGEQWKDE